MFDRMVTRMARNARNELADHIDELDGPEAEQAQKLIKKVDSALKPKAFDKAKLLALIEMILSLMKTFM